MHVQVCRRDAAAEADRRIASESRHLRAERLGHVALRARAADHEKQEIGPAGEQCGQLLDDTVEPLAFDQTAHRDDDGNAGRNAEACARPILRNAYETIDVNAVAHHAQAVRDRPVGAGHPREGGRHCEHARRLGEHPFDRNALRRLSQVAGLGPTQRHGRTESGTSATGDVPPRHRGKRKCASIRSTPRDLRMRLSSRARSRAP